MQINWPGSYVEIMRDIVDEAVERAIHRGKDTVCLVSWFGPNDTLDTVDILDGNGWYAPGILGRDNGRGHPTDWLDLGAHVLDMQGGAPVDAKFNVEGNRLIGTCEMGEADGRRHILITLKRQDGRPLHLGEAT